MELTTKARPPGLRYARTLLNVIRGGEEGAISFGNFLVILVQLGLILLVIRQFSVEEASGFLRIIPLVGIGFAVHAWLPLRLRLPFFFILSIVAIGITFGYPHGVMLIGIGLGLIAICHLPIAFAARIGLLLVAAAFLVSVRVEWIQLRWTALPSLVLPVVGAMFMFRLIIYLYDLRHEKKKASVWERLSYFFMFPNLFFLLFPVIDYQTYRRTYYDNSAFQIYQKGILWMFRGVVQLLLYRLIYHHVLPSVADVTDLAGVIQFMVATYLLYLRISGQFHLIIGIMCLFGFNLPETHHLYYLASSFNDYWRRINIYWKDFMMKIFYYPSFMRLRRFGTTTALVVATLIVFFGTWLLHSYQWLWLRGTFPITATDGLFWGILGLLVVGNSLLEARRGRKRSLGKPKWTFASSVKHAAKVVGMFVFLTILWALWSSPNLGEFISVLRIAGTSAPVEWMLLLLSLVALVALGVVYQYVASRRLSSAPRTADQSLRWGVGTVCVGALAMLGLAAPQVQVQLGEQASAVVASVQSERFNVQDRDMHERGYYEGLLNVDKYTSALWGTWKPKDWNQEEKYTRRTRDMFTKVLVPDSDVVDRGARLRTNRWGMRDRDYEQEKPPDTYRIAVLGASHVMGLGVEDHEPFEALFEERLNSAHGGGGYSQYEVLNFAVTAYGLLQQVAVVDERITPFEPDAVFYMAHNGELERTQERLNSWARDEVHLPHGFLRDVLREAQVDASMSRREIERRLRPFEQSLVEWGYRKIVDLCRERGMTPVWVYMPLMGQEEASDVREIARLTQLARDAGFVTISLEGVYDSHPVPDLMVAPWDYHPNSLGHRLVAERLYEEVLAQDETLEMGLSTGEHMQHTATTDFDY